MKTPISDVIVVVPGITGSVLERRGRVVWDKSWRTARNLFTGDPQFLEDLALDYGTSAQQTDAVKATRLIDGPSIIPGLAKLGGYSRLAAWLDQTFALVSETTVGQAPPNYLEFPYDWRLDNRQNARGLANFLAPRLDAWRRHSGVHDARIIIFAHSMGGLTARYYTEVLGGWRDCRLLVTLGTPHRGAVSALQTLMFGYRGLRSAVTETLRTFPSIYQLLPRYDFIEYDGTPGAYRTHTAASLPGIDQRRASDGHQFHIEIERAVHANAADDNYRQSYAVVPVIGTHQATPQKLHIKGGVHTVYSTALTGMPAGIADGDGIVPRVSAIPIEQSENDWHIFVPERHSALASSDYSLTAVCEPIRHMQGLGGVLRHYRDPSSPANRPTASGIRSEIPDLVYTGEPTFIRATVEGDRTAEQRLVATIVDAYTAQEVLSAPLVCADSAWQLDLGGLREGMYEVTLALLPARFGGPSPVHDVIAVLDPR